MTTQIDLVMITTCTSDSYIANMLESVTRNNKDINVEIISILQNNVKSNVESTNNTFIHYIHLNEVISLSKARNIALKYLFSESLSYNYIMFPDDDSSFDRDFFINFKQNIKSCSLIDVYGTGTTTLYKSHNFKDGEILSLKNYKNAMSVNIIIDSDTQKKVGNFDENLGVGNYYGAGEDADYYIRCINAGASFYYLKSLWNFHPMDSDKNNQMSLSHLIRRYRSYGRGQIYMLLKHNLKLEALKCVFSALFGSIIALFKLDLKLCLARSYAFLVRLKTFLNNL